MPAYHARISLEGSNTATGALIVNVLHAEVDTLTSPPDWNSIATDVYNWLGQAWLNMLSELDTFHQVVVTDENYPGSTFGQGVHQVNAGGTRFPQNTSLDPAVCGLMQWKTNTAKRYARGHTFAPPIYDSTDLTSFGSLTAGSAYYTAMVAFTSAYGPGHTAGSTSYIAEIFSRTQEKKGVVPFSYRITGWNIATKVHYLRSRITAP
jgi:hypothetical protein